MRPPYRDLTSQDTIKGVAIGWMLVISVCGCEVTITSASQVTAAEDSRLWITAKYNA